MLRAMRSAPPTNQTADAPSSHAAHTHTRLLRARNCLGETHVPSPAAHQLCVPRCMHATDASLEGFGVVSSVVPVAEVQREIDERAELCGEKGNAESIPQRFSRQPV